MAKTIKKALNTKLIKSKEHFSTELLERINFGNQLFETKIVDDEIYFNLKTEYSNWNDYNIELLKQSFNEPLNEYVSSYKFAGESSVKVTSWLDSRDVHRDYSSLKSKISIKIDNLNKLLSKISLLRSHMNEVSNNEVERIKKLNSKSVFIVHGHDEIAKLEVARFIENFNLKAIILHEQVNSGKTIIEKIEENTNVGFGIVLYTSCDFGGKIGDEKNTKNRARQNVVFEHGYLIGKIGRKNVCALVKGDIETPSDISGVVYISMNEDWKLKIAKEMKASGYEIDMNLALK